MKQLYPTKNLFLRLWLGCADFYSSAVSVRLCLLIGMLLGLQSVSQAQNYNISGSATVSPASTTVYYYQGGQANIYDQWDVSGGQIDWSQTDATHVTITWDASTGSGYITYPTYDYGSGNFGNDGYLGITIACGASAAGDNISTAIDLGTLAACGQYYSQACPVVTGNGTLLNDDFSYNVPNSGLWGAGAPDVYYRFTLVQPTTVTISTCGSNFDTVLFLLDGSNSQTPIDQNDDSHENYTNSSCHPNASKISRVLPAGTYFLIADGWQTADRGDIYMTITTSAAAPDLVVGDNQEIELGSYAVLTASGADTYTWSLNGTVIGYSAQVVVSPATTTTYTVTGAVCNGAKSSSKNVTVYVPQENSNYVITHVPTEAGFHTRLELYGHSQPPERAQTSTQYLDGLERPMQTVSYQASPSKHDMVMPIVYDALGRSPVTYLPYTDENTGLFKANALTKQAAFYQAVGDRVANDTAPWSVTEYEASPLNRVVRQGAPGAAWQPDGTAAWTSSDHTSKVLHRTNVAGEVRQWECGAASRAASSPGFYAAGQLSVTETKDENGHLSVQYVDKDEHMVLKKEQESASIGSSTADSGFLLTQYVYDDLSRLRLVIQPEGSRRLPQATVAGKLMREVWLNIAGTSVQNLPIGSAPNRITKLSSFEAPTDTTDNYGQRVRGYVTAPTTGDYTFWLASDDNAQLWLSTSDSPGQKQLIASVTDWTSSREWERDITPGHQKSVPITLQAGTRYYIEALHKEGGGGDNLAVGWQIPGHPVNEERPIPGSRLSTDVLILSAAFVNTWCFRYEYDEQGRLAEKQVPGAGPVELVYNRRNQIVLKRGTIPSGGGRVWECTKYDALNRPVLTGYVSFTNASSRADVQQQADNWTQADYERPTTTAIGYTYNEAFPAIASESDVATVAYYDTYDFSALASTGYATETGVGKTARSSRVAGLVTGRRERVVEESGNLGQWLTTVLSYDDDHQLIQSRRELYPSGWERTTYELDFTGRKRKSLVRHYFPNHTAAPEHVTLQEFDYDHADRLVEIRQQVDSQPKLVLARQEFNEIGQLVDKKLHSVDYLTSTGSPNASLHFLQSIDYRYTIRGWLSNINDRNLSNNGSYFNGADPNQDTNEDPDLFGMELMYDKNHNLPTSAGAAQYNGNISEVMWQTRNDATGNKLRGYSYHYDALNRVSSADFRTYELDQTDWQWKWRVSTTDYSVSNTTYDGNGNILTMNRKGCTSAPGATTTTWGDIDRLKYAYDGNRLLAVDDDATSASTHDFKDRTGAYPTNPTSAQREYEYDDVGNLIADKNKGATTSYNIINKLYLVNFTAANNAIAYTYSATGEKLQKHTYERNPNFGTSGNPNFYIEHITTYAGGFTYEDNVLKFTPTPEGRILYTNAPASGTLRWKYEYFLKDHLGNMRVAFRADKDNGTETQVVSMEPANAATEESSFAHVAETRLADPDRARSGRYVARLNARDGRKAGPTISFAVAAGDSIQADVYGRYDRGNAAGTLLQNSTMLLGATTTGLPIQQGGEYKRYTPARQRWLPFVGVSLTLAPKLLKWRVAKLPAAHLRYEVFNKDSQLVATHTQPMQRTPTDEWQHLRTGVKVDSAGYVRVSLVNESEVAAYFDDLQVNKVAAAPLQENNYDPFGLNLVGIESSSSYNTNFQYNGNEKQGDFGLAWTDYGARMYDPQLGRWHSIDPLAESDEDFSPYSYAYDNPLSNIDYLGLTAGETGGTQPAPATVPLGEVVVIGHRQDVGNDIEVLNNRLDNIQLTLDAAGFIPGVQTVAGIANAGIDVYRGNYGSAALNLVSAIPIAGYLAKGGKLAMIAVKVAKPLAEAKFVKTALFHAATYREWTKLAKYNVHHIIPQAVAKRFATEFTQIGFNVHMGENLRYLETGFHTSHPAYNKFVEKELLEIQRVGTGLTAGDMQNLITKMHGMMDAAEAEYKISKTSLNTYFKNLP